MAVLSAARWSPACSASVWLGRTRARLTPRVLRPMQRQPACIRAVQESSTATTHLVSALTVNPVPHQPNRSTEFDGYDDDETVRVGAGAAYSMAGVRP